MIQPHNRHMSFSLYISALALSDTIAVINGELWTNNVYFVLFLAVSVLCDLGHTCSLVRWTIMVRSVKDFLLVSMAVWSDGPKFDPTDHQNRFKQV